MTEPVPVDPKLLELVRRVDYDRYLCGLFAPPERRAALFALIAFNHEIARVRETVSEPSLGQIRLQWWRETIEGIYAGTPRRHDVAAALAASIARHNLARAPFDRLIDARERDLDDTPPASLTALAAYAEATSAPLARLMLDVVGAGDLPPVVEAATHASSAFALIGLMRAVPFHARQSRLYLPVDRLAAHGASPADVTNGRFSAALGATIADVLALAETELQTTARSPRAARPVLLMGRLARLYLDRLRSRGCDPYDAAVSLSPLRRQLSLAVANLTGRI
jgi:phytoene synthase